jgi:DHA2 family multidrug resistance protein
MLARGAQTHQAAMVAHLTPYDPAFQERVHQLAGAAATPGVSAAPSVQTYGAIYGTLVKQATLMSYIDNFRLLAFLCVLCIPAVFLFKRVKSKGGSVAVH